MESTASQSGFPFSLALGSKSMPPSKTQTTFLNLRKGTNYAQVYKELLSTETPTTHSMALKLAKELTCVTASNDKGERVQSIFDAPKLPKISVQDYFVRIAKFGMCSLEAMVLCIVYLDRFFESTLVCLSTSNIHRCFD